MRFKVYLLRHRTSSLIRHAAHGVPDQVAVVIKWSPFDNLATISSGERQEFFKKLKQRFSDHLPVVSRFYLTNKPAG